MTAGYTLLFLFIAGQKQQLIVVELVELIKALDPPDLFPVVVLDVETLKVADDESLNYNPTSHLSLNQQILKVLQLNVGALLQVEELEADQTAVDGWKEGSLQPHHSTELEVDQELAPGDNGPDPEIRHLIAPVQLESPQVGTVPGNAGDPRVVQLGALREVEVDEVVKVTSGEG